jgi:putative transposase
MSRDQVSERRATRAARFCLSSIRYESCRDPLTALRQRLRELAQTRVRSGYRRLPSSCAAKGGTWARNASIGSTSKRGWHSAGTVRGDMPLPCIGSSAGRATARNDIWSMDFVADQLADGRRFRALTVLDLLTRECLRRSWYEGPLCSLTHPRERPFARHTAPLMLRSGAVSSATF